VYKNILALGFILSVAGCYTPNDEMLKRDVGVRIKRSMGMQAAVDALQDDGFYCQANSTSFKTECSRIRQRLLPSSCIERVNLTSDEGKGKVDNIDVERIVCAGF
jgi:hypothetical protein